MTVAAEVVVAAYRALPDSPPVDDEGYGVELRAVAGRARDAVVLVAVDAGAGDEAVDDEAVDDEAVLGCVTYVPDERSPLAEDVRPGEASIRMLAVAPWAQGRGVGRALVEACIAHAQAAGKDRVVLHSGAWMHAAHRLYENLGFEHLPERDWLPLPDVPLLAYKLELRRA